ncbi:conserved hypothetical protein [Theileria equi strain WA]|uniref:Importin N-terminal domain-containing protein n=1 Tax=Theileria equi strain WA TaxID=1537102 RepID=L1LFL0_THEEQ|nr:conserved hypothetical protein [Theileria equi strain WA]EKX74059.1 conserved hypothetical protein [Theileria equi strain WA]|eukprot:XP_004833511.1 conserved hypothetical protein [Theileria equi strain WA]
MSDERSFAIELLRGSISPIDNLRNSATKQILDLEKNESFLLTLLEITTSSDVELAKLAFVCLKNALSKICASSKVLNPTTGQSGIHSYNSILLIVKEGVVSILNSKFENDLLVPKDFALLIRKICRSEYPLNWIELHETLQSKLEFLITNDENKYKLFNVIFVTYHIFKERTSMRLFKDRNITIKLSDHFYPYISKLWVKQWIDRWKSGSLQDNIFLNAPDVHELNTSLYLDSIILNLYSYGLREIYKGEEFLELLRYIFLKVKVHFHLIKIQKCFVKNLKRLLKGLIQLIEHEPMSFVFLDFSVILNEVFDSLLVSIDASIEEQCLLLLTALFTSPVMNNERYANEYFEYYNNLPTIPSSIAPISYPASNTKKSGDGNFVYYKTFDEMKMALESPNPVKLSLSPKPSSSPLKGPNQPPANLSEKMQRQVTFMLYECISSRGGFVQFIEFLRKKYLKLTQDKVEEWANEDIVPVDPPFINSITELISAMNINMISIFNYTFNGIVESDDFLNRDSFIQLYLLTFQDLSNFHSYKHYNAILSTVKMILNNIQGPCAKLLIYRCSRMLNLWSKKNLLDGEVKIELLKFLVNCMFSEGDSEFSINLRTQHLIPLYNLNLKTQDEEMWTILFKEINMQSFITNLLSVAKTDIPVIQNRCLELVCKLCMEFDEYNDLSTNLLSIISVYGSATSSMQLMEPILTTSLGFVNTLDWQKCFSDDMYINPHFLRYLLSLLSETLVFQNTGQRKIILSISKYALMEDSTLILWLSILRILPRKVYRLDKTIVQNIFILFPIFVDFLIEPQPFGDSIKIRALLLPSLAIDIVAEYLALVVDLEIGKLSSDNESKSIFSTKISNIKNDIFYCLDGLEINLSNIQKLAIYCMQNSNDEEIISSSLQCFNNLFFGFRSLCIGTADLTQIIGIFWKRLVDCSTIEPELEVRPGYMSCLTDGTPPNGSEKWQYMKLPKTKYALVEKILPTVCRLMFDSSSIFSEVFLDIFQRDSSSFDSVILAITNIFSQVKHNIYLQLGSIICTCNLLTSISSKYKVKAFIQVQNMANIPSDTGSQNPLGFSSGSCKPHANFSGVFLPCHFLRIINSIFESTSTKAFKNFSRPSVNDEKLYNNIHIPPSSRIQLLTNISTTHKDITSSIDSTPTEIFNGALQSAIYSIVQVTKVLSRFDNGITKELLYTEMQTIYPQIMRIVTDCCNTSNL